MLNNIDKICDELDKNVDAELKLKLEAFNEHVDANLIAFDYADDNKEIFRKTLIFVEEKFPQIYSEFLENILPVLKKWGFKNLNTGKVPDSIEELHETRLKDCFIEDIQFNCLDIKEGYVVFSFIFRFDYMNYGYDDGLEAVYIKDRLVFWSDGNSREYLFEYEDHKGEIGYLL